MHYTQTVATIILNIYQSVGGAKTASENFMLNALKYLIIPVIDEADKQIQS